MTYRRPIQSVSAIAEMLNHIEHDSLPVSIDESFAPVLDYLKKALEEQSEPPKETKTDLVHPLQIVRDLRELLSDDITVTCDIGSHAIWMSRYFRT